MHSETNDRIQRIRSRVLAERASISGLKTQLTGNTDKYVNEQLNLTSNWFDDVEVGFLGIFRDDPRPRTLAEESWVLDQTEFFLERVAIPQLKAIQEMVATFGPNVRSVG
jgi:hypothetical protein